MSSQLTECSGHVLEVIFFLSEDHCLFTGTLYWGKNKIPVLRPCGEIGSWQQSEFFERHTLNCSMSHNYTVQWSLCPYLRGEALFHALNHPHSLHLGRFQSQSPHPASFCGFNWESCCSLERTKHLRSCARVFRTPWVKYQEHDLAESRVLPGSAAPGAWFCCCSGCRSSGEPASQVQALHSSPEQQQEINSQGNLLSVKLSSAGRQLMKATDRKYL